MTAFMRLVHSRHCANVGDYAAVCGIDVLVGIRGAACHMVDAAKRAGLTSGAALFFDDPVAAGTALRTLASPGDAILFKGSRGVHVERALEQYMSEQQLPEKQTPEDRK